MSLGGFDDWEGRIFRGLACDACDLDDGAVSPSAYSMERYGVGLENRAQRLPYPHARSPLNRPSSRSNCHGLVTADPLRRSTVAGTSGRPLFQAFIPLPDTAGRAQQTEQAVASWFYWRVLPHDRADGSPDHRVQSIVAPALDAHRFGPLATATRGEPSLRLESSPRFATDVVNPITSVRTCGSKRAAVDASRAFRERPGPFAGMPFEPGRSKQYRESSRRKPSPGS